ncbi:MAG: hypothetical protein M0R80_00350 [Proteobacteria bacterium]|jgi:hypothetical protein|nr:hypothetical protein [Pseudomonadota bacterium]
MSEDGRKGAGHPLVGGSIGRRGKFAQTVRVPVGLEKLLYLAARDPDLRERLLADRAGTIATLGVALRPSEKAMLEAAPRAALEAMIGRIDASNPRKRKFMTLVAAAATTLAAGTAAMSCDGQDAVMAGGANDIDTDIDTDADAGQDASAVDTDTDTYAGGGALTDLDPEDLERK